MNFVELMLAASIPFITQSVPILIFALAIFRYLKTASIWIAVFALLRTLNLCAFVYRDYLIDVMHSQGVSAQDIASAWQVTLLPKGLSFLAWIVMLVALYFLAKGIQRHLIKSS